MRFMMGILVLVAVGCAPRPQGPTKAPPPANVKAWGFGVGDLARVEALSGAGRVRLPVPGQLWGKVVAALDSAKEAEEPGALGPRSPVLRLELKRGGELRVDLIGREHWRLVRQDGETPLAPCPALKSVCGVALRLACAAGADEILVARVAGGEGESILEVVRTLKGSAVGRLSVQGGPLPLPGGPEALCLAFLRVESDGVGVPRYHRLMPVGTLWEHNEGMEAKLRESIPLPEKWGRAIRGLRMGLRAREGDAEPGGEAAIEICIQNVGKEPVRLLQHRMNQYDYYPFTSLEVTLPGGEKRDLSKPVTMMKDLDRPRERLLPPGETYICTVRLDHWGAFRQPGFYEITCTYSVKPEQGSKGCWTGTLASPPIKLRVRPSRTGSGGPV